ncbi:MAG: hypothetical protein HUU54_03565 [Ignavibacteriaceae bacterium]|nr:hypothetical protein [Ignavibacteriaceae bacterium]
MKNHGFVVSLILSISLFLHGCDGKIQADETQKSSSDEKLAGYPEENTIEGVYTYEDSFSGMTASINIYGDSWSGTVNLSGDIEFSNGTMKGKDLYEESGFVRVGYVSGKSLYTSLGGRTLTLKKEN